MIEITIFGRGGRGARLASEILAGALTKKGRHIHCFPFFGSERIGQPVKSFVRLDSKPIRLKCQIKQADYLITFGEDILSAPDFEPKNNLKPNGWLIINSPRKSEELSRLFSGYQVAAFNASVIAKKHNLNRLNAIILGAFAKMTNLFSFEDLVEVLKEKIPSYIKENIEAAKEAYGLVEPLQEAQHD
ncbi:MAG: 2-oxoacid:acceptor oxidoreductase family protein [Candidatus Nealsonbacteria bacterium]|nr:2-oxoacid:acceptor oxidoreductase family protein [Candidatus Nealsonbacteria bacterium]